MSVRICTGKDVYPFGLTEEEEEYIEIWTAEWEQIRATPPCPICGESAQFFRDGQCPYINADDHKSERIGG